MVSPAACFAAALERRVSTLNAGNNREKAGAWSEKSKQRGSTGV